MAAAVSAIMENRKGSPMGAARGRRGPSAVRGRCTRSASRDTGAAAHGGAAVAGLARLHGLSLAAVGDRIEPEVVAHGVDVHQVVAGVGGHSAIAKELAQLALADLVHAPRGDTEVLAALGDR